MLEALDGDPSTLRLFLKYLVSVGTRNTLPVLNRAARNAKAEPEATMQTIKQHLLSQGKRQGLKKGLEKGRVETLRDALRKVLSKRFKVTAAVESRLTRADAHTLGVWFDNALTAKSMKAVFD